MRLIDKLKSDKTFEETTYYGSNNSGSQGRVSDDANATSGRNNEIKTGPPVPIIVDLIQPWELAKQETKRNRIITGLYNSRDKLSKLEEKRTLENHLNQLRYNMSFRDIIPLPEGLEVDTPFPLEIFPDLAVRLISAIAHSLQVRIEAVAPALLGATFIGARGNYVIEVKSDYQEALTGYIIVTIPSGGRKSAIVDFFRKPINDHEAKLQNDFHGNATSRKSYHEASVAIKRKVKSKIIAELDLESSDGIKDATMQLSKKLEIIDREDQQLKARPKLLIDRPTSKGLSLEMARQGEAIGIMEPEGGILKHRIRSSDDDIYLKGYTGESYGDETTTGSVNMRRPCLAICIYVQEPVAEELYSNDALKGDGFLARFLPVFVSKKHGDRDHNPTDVSDELLTKYSKKFRSLFSIQRPTGQKGERTVHVIKLIPEARKSWQEYATRIARRISAGYFQDCEAFGEKLAGHAVRLAGALHLLKYDVPHEHQIDAATMDGGIALAEFFAKHASVAFDKSYLQGIKHAKKILKWIDKHGIAQFNARDAQHGINRCTIVDIRAGLDVLERNGFIGCIYTTKSIHCVVNPNYKYNLGLRRGDL